MFEICNVGFYNLVMYYASVINVFAVEYKSKQVRNHIKIEIQM